MDTNMRKGGDGWRAETRVDLGPVTNHRGEGMRVLTINTWKHSNGGIYTSASAAVHLDGMTSFEIFGDFHKTLIPRDGTKCTEKAVRQWHERALLQVDGVVAEAKAFYAAKDAKRAEEDARRTEREALEPSPELAQALQASA